MESLLIFNQYHISCYIDYSDFAKIWRWSFSLGVSQDNFTSTRSVGTFLQNLPLLLVALFIICSIAIVVISRDELRETQSVLEKEEEENSNLPQIPQSK